MTTDPKSRMDLYLSPNPKDENGKFTHKRTLLCELDVWRYKAIDIFDQIDVRIPQIYEAMSYISS